MTDLMLPLSFLNLLLEFRGVFTAPSFDNFRVLVSGFVHSFGRPASAMRFVVPVH